MKTVEMKRDNVYIKVQSQEKISEINLKKILNLLDELEASHKECRKKS